MALKKKVDVSCEPLQRELWLLEKKSESQSHNHLEPEENLNLISTSSQPYG